MTLHAFYRSKLTCSPKSSMDAYDLTSFCALLNVCHELLLLLLELGAFTIQLPSSFGECPLVLPQSFRRSDCSSKESFLIIALRTQRARSGGTHKDRHYGRGQLASMDALAWQVANRPKSRIDVAFGDATLEHSAA